MRAAVFTKHNRALSPRTHLAVQTADRQAGRVKITQGHMTADIIHVGWTDRQSQDNTRSHDC